MTGPVVLGDWGTTRLRLFLVADGAIARRADGPGIGAVGAEAAAALREALAGLTGDTPPEMIFLCGMAGASGALVEAPYARCPADEQSWARLAMRDTFDGAPLAVAAGLRCGNFADAPDVMRGEETQIFGAIALRRDLARGRHLLIHPGTHAKWIMIEDGVVERFHTFPTGEIFALLRDRSTLLRARSERGDAGRGFEAGLARGRGGLLAHLFEARAAQLLEGRSVGWAEAFLSGALIAAEVREALELARGAERAVVIGDPVLCGLYERALAEHGIAVESIDGEACVLAGFRRLAATEAL